MAVECCVCQDMGCEYCPKVTRNDLSESFPDETFSLFSNHDLVQLLTDVCVELGRRDQGIMVNVS